MRRVGPLASILTLQSFHRLISVVPDRPVVALNPIVGYIHRTSEKSVFYISLVLSLWPGLSREDRHSSNRIYRTFLGLWLSMDRSRRNGEYIKSVYRSYMFSQPSTRPGCPLSASSLLLRQCGKSSNSYLSVRTDSFFLPIPRSSFERLCTPSVLSKRFLRMLMLSPLAISNFVVTKLRLQGSRASLRRTLSTGVAFYYCRICR